jgi:hypothetical protein
MAAVTSRFVRNIAARMNLQSGVNGMFHDSHFLRPDQSSFTSNES